MADQNTPAPTDLVEAVREVLNHAYYLLDDTANDNPPEVPQDSWDNLAKAVEALEGLIPEDEQPCIIGVAARLIAAQHRTRMTSEGDVKVIKRAVMDDLLREIYRAEGWTWRDKAGFETVAGRVQSVYEISVDSRGGRYVAHRRAAAGDAFNDAARYRWLRDHSCPPHNFYISVPDEFHGVRYSPQVVDAYIDAARTALANSQGPSA